MVVPWGGLEGAIPVPTIYPPGTLIFNIFSLKVSTHGQMKAFFEVSDEVSEIWSRYGLRIDLILTSESTLQTHPQTGRQMTLRCPYPDLRKTHGPE